MDNSDLNTGIDQLDTATFGAGCFWCVEAIFKELEGVASVEPGYTGGAKPNPTYDEVCTGTTGHAEVCQIKFNPKTISFEELLHVFWLTHDPTTLNRQGGDVGTQYRSAVFFHTPEQESSAREILAKLTESDAFSEPITTEITPIGDYYVAENYHHDYYRLNREQPYCQSVVRPKLEKFRQVFVDSIKHN